MEMEGKNLESLFEQAPYNLIGFFITIDLDNINESLIEKMSQSLTLEQIDLFSFDHPEYAKKMLDTVVIPQLLQLDEDS